MREILIDNISKININELPEYAPVFAVKDGNIEGMLIHEPNGWIIRFPSHSGLSGHFKERKDCLKSAISYGYVIWTQ